MMAPPRNLPLRRELAAISVLISGVALAIACCAFIFFEGLVSRDELLRESLDTATMIGYNNAAALSFGDRDSARAALTTLSHQPSIAAAVIYDQKGNPFAAYHNPVTAPDFVPSPARHNFHAYGAHGLELFQDIQLAGEPAGVIYLRHDLSEARALQRRYLWVAAAVMLAALLVNWLISFRLHRRISHPISHLLDVARDISAGRNYSVRAVKERNDELGELVDGFNSMLQQIQMQDSALKDAHDTLERRVDERTRELADSLSLLNATLNSTNDGILAMRFTGEIDCYNSQFAVMWGFPGGVIDKTWTTQRTLAFAASQVKDPQAYRNRMAEMRRNPSVPTHDIIELNDGRTFERFVKPQRLGDKLVGVVINVRDISQRKQAEREVDNVHQQLVSASRQAGMAEVATSVLHNVGNVLNSVNVSANLAISYVRNSRVSSLARVATMVREHGDDLPRFLAEHSKGRQLPRFFSQLIHHLMSEQRLILAELQSLHENIEHINEIVSMQQSNAKVFGVLEVVNMIDLVEDTLRMNDGGMQRHGIKVDREFEPVPTVITEKHKILQILINLLRNAKNACSESSTRDKRLTLRVVNGGDRISITVSDNGVGIAAENLTRMFSHGFTTRKDGHGFGLHSSALAARELGGSLSAASAGLGRGASFTLELPLAPAQSEVA